MCENQLSYAEMTDAHFLGEILPQSEPVNGLSNTVENLSNHSESKEVQAEKPPPPGVFRFYDNDMYRGPGST